MAGYNPQVRNPSYERTKLFRPNPPIWARWDYDPVEWAAYAEWEWNHARTKAVLSLRPYAIITALGLLISGGVIFYTRDLRWIILTVVVLWVCGGTGLMNWWLKYSQARQLHYARQRGDHTIIITPIGITQAGSYTPLIEPQQVLRKVAMTNDKYPLLHFYLTLYQRGATQYEIRVPVPNTKISEAIRLVDQFQREVAS